MAYNWLGADFVPLAVNYVLSFIMLSAGSITDLKTREVPDWINYGLIISGIGLNLLFSVIYSNSSFIINSIIGLSIFFGIAYIMFYAGQWGGGDSKMLMGLGAMIGIDVSFKEPQFLFAFFINALFIGAIYGVLWSIFLVFKNKNNFWKEWNRISNKPKLKKWREALLIVALLALLIIVMGAFFNFKILILNHLLVIQLILSALFLILITFYLWIFVKAVERSSMHKLVEPQKLTEGDWIVKDVFVDNKYICGPKDLGIGKKQINKLIEFYKQGKIKKILIKEGIPFVPSFFIAFVVTFIFGNPLNWLIF